MQFPPFEHACFLGDAGDVRHNIGASGFIAPDWSQRGLPEVDSSLFDTGALHMTPEKSFRDALAHRHGVDPSMVQTTAGASAANLSVLLHTLEPGCEVVSERPYYQPLPALAEGLGASVQYVDRDPRDDWKLDLEKVQEACTPDTRLIALCSPNNPTGAAMGEGDMKALAEIAEDVDAFVLIDHIFQELTGHPSAIGLHERIIVTSGFNKMWGCPSLRTGWVIGEPKTVFQIQNAHQYAVLAPPPFGERLGVLLLESEKLCQKQLHDRLRQTHPIYKDWLEETGFEGAVDPQSAVAFPRVPVEDTRSFANAVRHKHSIVTVPGEFFGRPGHLRIGLGADPEALAAGLTALTPVLQQVA